MRDQHVVRPPSTQHSTAQHDTIHNAAT